MRYLMISVILFLFAFTASAQNRSDIFGDWHIKEFEDFENGQNYFSQIDFQAKVTFSKGGLYRGSRLCNGIGGVYQIEENKMVFTQSGYFTKVNCVGANAVIENAFRSYNEELTLEGAGPNFYIILPGKFRMLLSRFP